MGIVFQKQLSIICDSRALKVTVFDGNAAFEQHVLLKKAQILQKCSCVELCVTFCLTYIVKKL